MVSSELLSVNEAIETSGMPKNFLMKSGEVQITRKGRRIFFSKDELEKWEKVRTERTYELNLNDYAKCFDFSLAMLYRGYTSVDWGSSRRREAGQNITNWIRGQLGEIAVQKFLKDKFGLDIELDFDLHEDIVPQDIVAIRENGKLREPKLKIAIKATKMKNCFLILGSSEVELANRKSDIYMLTRIDLPDDHLMRISKNELEKMLKEQRYFSSYKDKMKDFEPIGGEVVGFCRIEDLEKITDKSILKQMLGTANPTGYRYVKASGKLKSSGEDWKEIIKKM
jgi:hypothetical protein